jgi:hypothetical protein
MLMRQLGCFSAHTPQTCRNDITIQAFSRMQVSVLLSVFFLFVIQRIAFEVLGTGPTGTLLIDAVTILANSLAIGCCIAASRSGRGLSRATSGFSSAVLRYWS